MLTYIAPNLTADLNNSPYPVYRVGVAGKFNRHGRDGDVAEVDFLLWADAVADPQGGYVVALHMDRPNRPPEDESSAAVHILGAGSKKRFETLDSAIVRVQQLGNVLLEKDVTSSQLLAVLKDRIMMIVVQPPPPEDGVAVDVPPNTNFH